MDLALYNTEDEQTSIANIMQVVICVIYFFGFGFPFYPFLLISRYLKLLFPHIPSLL